MTKEENSIKIGNNIRLLLKANNLKESDLANLLNISNTTISNIVTNNVNARVATIIPIAKFFNVSLGQLVGTEPLPHLNSSAQIRYTPIPILTLEETDEYLKGNLHISEIKEWLGVEANRNESFAIKSTKSYKAYFRSNAFLIVEKNTISKDGDVAVIKENNRICLRQLMFDGSTVLLKSLISNEISKTKIADLDVVGIITEVRYPL